MADDSIFSPRYRGGSEPIDVTPPPRPAGDQEPFGLGTGTDGDPPSGSPGGASTRRKIVLGVVAALGVVAFGVAGVFGARIVQQKDATLTPPESVAGLTRDDSETALSTADDLRSAFAAGIDLDQSVGAVYTDPGAAERSVLLFGGTTLLWSPERDLDTLFGLVADDAGAVEGLHEVDAGELGGVMKCGRTATEGGDISVCGWADHGSVAIGLFPGRGQDEAGSLLLEMREATQTRD
jgi:hypothetical protein